MICEFLCQCSDIFNEGNIQNIATEEILDNSTKEFLLNYNDRGDKLFKKFRSNRIVLKNKMLFDKIAKEVVKTESNQDQPLKDLKTESTILLQIVDVPHTCYDIT